MKKLYIKYSLQLLGFVALFAFFFLSGLADVKGRVVPFGLMMGIGLMGVFNLFLKDKKKIKKGE